MTIKLIIYVETNLFYGLILFDGYEFNGSKNIIDVIHCL